jgi:membrane protein DedA with SNARE-associated domain
MVDVAEPLLEFVKAHSDWAAVVIFITAFGESFPVLGLLFPGTSVLIAAGALLAAGTLPTWPILIGAVLGPILGDEYPTVSAVVSVTP